MPCDQDVVSCSRVERLQMICIFV